jgi:preprotein translocase subunit SecD
MCLTLPTAVHEGRHIFHSIHRGGPRPLCKLGLAALLLECLLTVQYAFADRPKGGSEPKRATVLLVYDYEPPEPKQEFREDLMVKAVQRRIDPTGSKRIRVIAAKGPTLEITIPSVTEEDLLDVKRSLTESGTFAFRVLAHENDSASGVDMKELMESAKDPKVTPEERNWVGDRVKPTAIWVPILTADLAKRFHDKDREDRNGVAAINGFLTRRVMSKGQDEIQNLAIKDPLDVDTARKGVSLATVSPVTDDTRAPAIRFVLSDEGAKRMEKLTAKYLPQNGRRYHLGIILNGYLTQAPLISSQIKGEVQISGYANSADGKIERDRVIAVLRAGQLPARLNVVPIAEFVIEKQDKQ